MASLELHALKFSPAMWNFRRLKFCHFAPSQYFVAFTANVSLWNRIARDLAHGRFVEEEEDLLHSRERSLTSKDVFVKKKNVLS